MRGEDREGRRVGFGGGGARVEGAGVRVERRGSRAQIGGGGGGRVKDAGVRGERRGSERGEGARFGGGGARVEDTGAKVKRCGPREQEHVKVERRGSGEEGEGRGGKSARRGGRCASHAGMSELWRRGRRRRGDRQVGSASIWEGGWASRRLHRSCLSGGRGRGVDAAEAPPRPSAHLLWSLTFVTPGC